MPHPEATPRFSILVPTYNQAGFLPAALASLQAQTRGDWEAVVVDDGSTDATWEVLTALAQADPRIRPHRQANGGVGAALNRALEEVRGAWICWLSSDDLLLPEALEVFEGAIQAHPGVRFFHADFLELLHPAGTLRPGPPDRARTLPAPPLQTLQFLLGNYIHGISICVQRSLFAEVGTFKPELRHAQDMDMWLRMSARTPLHFLDRRLCVTRVHTGQGTHGFPEAGMFDSARACLDFLNAHPFEDLFPQLDLASADGITAAIQAALGAVLQPQAAMYAGVGPEPALLERTGEWLASRCPGPYRPSLREGLRQLGGQLEGAPPAWVAAVRTMAEGKPMAYRTRDALALMAAEQVRAEGRGDRRGAATLTRYLDLARGVKPAREAFLLRVTAEDEAWLEALVAYLQAFRPGEPVSLLLDLQGSAGSLAPEEVEQVVGDVVGRLGLTAFPDLQILEDGMALLEALRAHPVTHRLPIPAAGLREATALQQRLARQLSPTPA